MKQIPNWSGREFLCSRCGTEESVKYIYKEEEYCNRCVMVVISEDDSVDKMQRS